MNAVTIRTLAEVPAAVNAVLRFTPTESLVVLSLGGGPTARVDLGPESVEALSEAVHYWDRVMILVYSATPQAEHYRDAFTLAYPGVNVLDTLDVQGNTVTSLAHGITETIAPIAPGILGDRIIAESRADIVAEADLVTDSAEALRLAEAYYRAGDGARAWAFVDRTRDLGGDPSTVEAWLTSVTDPKEIA